MSSNIFKITSCESFINKKLGRISFESMISSSSIKLLMLMLELEEAHLNLNYNQKIYCFNIK